MRLTNSLAGIAALGQDFFLELRRQVAALQQVERAIKDEDPAAMEGRRRISGEAKWEVVKPKARRGRRHHI